MAIENQPGPSTCPQDRLFLGTCSWTSCRGSTHLPAQLRTSSINGFDGLPWKRMSGGLLMHALCATSRSHLTRPQLASSNPYPFLVPHLPCPVTGLPPSQGNTVIPTIVDRLSKMVHFIPLLKLASDKETSELMLQQVFCLHCLPVDVVSDLGPVHIRVLERVLQFTRNHCEFNIWISPPVQWSDEWMNQDMETTCQCMVSQNPSS